MLTTHFVYVKNFKERIIALVGDCAMAGKTGISWTNDTWNPVMGCSLVSPGCTNCYAMKQAARMERMGSPKYAGLTKVVNGSPVWTGEVRVADENTMTWPLRVRRPRLVFTNSMSDLFHEGLPRAAQFRVLDVMREADHHKFQVLTKRAGVMRDAVGEWLEMRGLEKMPEHVWLGVSVEDQKRADLRVPVLASIPCPVRFLSMEPLLGPVTLVHLPTMEWVIVGGESVERGRPRTDAAAFDPAWAVSLLEESRARGSAFHFKQLGCNPVSGFTLSFKGDKEDEFPDELRVREWPKGFVMAS